MKDIKVIVDAHGGDFAPEEIVKGVALAVKEKENLHAVLVGQLEPIYKILSECQTDISRIEMIEAKDVILNEDVPVTAIRNKPDSSLVVALKTLKEREDIGGMVSAGNSGAVLAGATLKLGRLKGVARPCLMSTFPSIIGGKVLLADCGANVDTKPEYMAQFALMANTYCKEMLKVENPRVALLNVGVEEDKGDDRTKQVHEILKKLPINFVGNMESRDYLSGKYDLIISDGFSGNVLMKGTEGAGRNFLKVFKGAVKSSFWAKVGVALFMGKALKNMKKFSDFGNYGGALFLGVKKVITKCHGTSKANSIRIAMLETAEMIEMNMIQSVQKAIDDHSSIFMKEGQE